MAGTLVSYLPFTRSITEDLSGKEWTVTGNPQIVIRPDFPVPVAQFGENDSIELPDILLGGWNTWLMDFWIFIPQNNSTSDIIRSGGSDWFHSILTILDSGKLRVKENKSITLDGIEFYSSTTSDTYFNKWVNIKLLYYKSGENEFRVSLSISNGTNVTKTLYCVYLTINSDADTSAKVGSILIGNSNIFISQFRFYMKRLTDMLDLWNQVLPNPPTASGELYVYSATRENFVWNEFQVHDTVNFDYRDNIIYSAYPKSQQWIYKNIGTADDLLVSGTSLTNVSPSKSITSKAFYQVNEKKCFDIQASKEIYMLFDVYHGAYRWEASEKTNSTTGIIAQTSSVLIYSNGTNVGSIPHTINKLETYLLYIKSDSTNGVIEVYKDGEYKYRYIGNVNNGDDFSNLVLKTNSSDNVFSNVVISNQPVYDSDRWVGNYNTIQRTLSNETWTKEKNLKALLPSLQKMDLCDNEWTAYGDPTVSDGYLQLNNSYLRSKGQITFGGQDFTISFYGNLNSNSGDFAVLFGAQSTTNIGGENSRPGQITLNRNDLTNGFRCSAFNASGTRILGESLSNENIVNARHHFEIDYSHDESKLRVFVDGQINLTASITLERVERYIFLGATPYSDPSNKTVGTIDEFQIYDGVVLHTEDFTPPTTEDYTTYRQQLTSNATFKDHLVSWLSFEPSTDLCGNAWWYAGTTNLPFITTINEVNGRAVQFGQGYIYTNPPALRSNNFTIDFWEYIPSTVNGLTAQMVVIDGTDGTDTQCLYIGYHNGATVPSFWLGKGASSGWKYSKVIGTKIRDKWVHRAVVRYNDKIYAFENGQLYTSFDIEYNMYIDITGSSLFIGGFKRASGLYPGMLSEVRVYVGYAVWTENFTPPNQEDYFETYWYFNKPAPILNTNYNMFRSLINASKIWKYINPGYPDLCVSSQYSGITYEPLDQESSVAITETTNIDLTNMKYITDDEIWIKWTVSHYVTIPRYSINIMNEDSEYITFYHQGIVGHFFSNVDNTDLFKQNDSQHHSFDVNNVPSGSYCILHVKSHITNGIIELFVNNDLGSIKVIQGNINAGKKFTKVNLQIDASYYSTEISNIIISTGQLTSSDKIASNLIPVQYTLTNDEEWRFAKYVLQSWMLFENSPTEDLCGNTWTAYNNPSIIDTDVLHGKALKLNSGQYLSMTNTISLGDKDLTISGWYNMSTSSGTWASMFTFWQTANGGHIIKLGQNGTSKGLAWDFSLGTYALGTNIDNKLHHFAYVYQAETKKISIYIDGKRLIYGSEEISRYDYKLYLGKSNYSADKAYVGTINEFKVYDGYAEFTEEFTPPIPQLVSNKLYYNKSTQTMKFEYFANVQVNIVNIAYNINRTNMFLRDYIPLHNDLEDKVGNVNPDRSDDYARMRAANTGDIIAIESVFTNNTLDFKKYAIIYSNNDRTEKAESQGYLSIPNINSLLNSKFILQAQLFDVKFYQTSNSLLTNTLFSIFGQGLEQILLMVGYTNHLLLQANVKKSYSASFSSINNFQLTVIYDYDNLHIIISSINENTGDTKLEIVYNIDLTQSQPNFSRNINEILFGSDINTSMRNAIHYLSEIKIYQDFNPEVSSDVIDNYITYQFNNNEESVYFEFYANTQISSKYLKIISQAFNKKFLIDDWNVKDNPPSSFLITQDIVGSELSDNLISADPLIPGGKYYQAPIKEYNFKFRSDKTLSIGKKILFIATFLVTKMYNITFYISSRNYSRSIWINPYSDDGELQKIHSSDNLGELSYINEDNVVTENNTIISIAIEIQNDSISLYMNHTLKATWNWQGILSLLFPNNTLTTTTFSIRNDYLNDYKLYIQRASLYDLPEGKNLMDISSSKISIRSSSSSIDPPRIAIYHNNSTYYNKLVLPTDPNASKIRIYHNDTVYALSK